jgi:diguanylate cyclase (GGDEF)-like protein/PAS domain S-box-containing protein
MSEGINRFQRVPEGGAGGDSIHDAAELARLRAELVARDRQENAISELGQAALTGVDPLILLGQACALVELTLQVSHCRALEITRTGQVLLRASIGTNETFSDCTRDAEEDESIGMAVMLSEAPMTFVLEPEETRFRWTHMRNHHGVRSGAGQVIRTQNGAFGVLLAFSGTPRIFADYELAFLTSVANIVGGALMRSHTEDALRRSESRLRHLIANTLDAVVTIDSGLRVIEWNRQAEAMFRLASRDVLGHTLRREILGRGGIGLVRALMRRARSGRPSRLFRHRMEISFPRPEGDLPVEITIAPGGTGADTTLTFFTRDLSERRRAESEREQREKRFRTIVEKSWSGVVLLDAELRFTWVSSSTQHLIGWTDEELVGRSLLDFVHPRERDAAARVFDEILSAPNHESHGELRFRHKGGRWIWLEGFSQNLIHEPSVAGIVLNYRDVSLRKQTEKQLEYRAHYDSLTGLPNRLLFRDRLVNALAHAQRNRAGVAVMYLDVDRFKLVNDGMGHSFGDLLLADVAARLREALRASDTVSRIGGDEFSILLPEVASADAVASVARKILEAMTPPFRVRGHELVITASIGISCYPADGEDAESLLRCADAAMYRAKELGRNQAQMFTSSMNERYVRRLALEQHLHHAIERNQLELHYQPVYDRVRRRVVSVEALLRWRDPARGLVPPGEFIQLAEETGMIVPMGRWVLDTACRQLRTWQDEGLAGLRVAVNISAVQLQQPGLVEAIRESMEQHRIAPESLQLEITESIALQNFDTTMAVLRELRDMGLTLAIDDFGTGHSSLVYLRHLPIDTVKIDKEFLRDIATDDTAAAIVSYVISLAHTLNLKVVAEGVETEDQFMFLRHYSCDLLQGYYFGRPMPAEEVSPFVRHFVVTPRTGDVTVYP